MASEREKLRNDERRFRLFRQRLAVWFAFAFLSILTVMLLIVKPVAGLFGRDLTLPYNDEVMLLLVAMGWATLGAFDLGAIGGLLSVIQIRIGRGGDRALPSSTPPLEGIGDDDP